MDIDKEMEVEVERPVGKKALKERRKREKETTTRDFSESSATIKDLVVQLDKMFVKREEMDKEKLELRKTIEMKHEVEMKKLEFKEKALERQYQDFVRIEKQKILSMFVDSVLAQYHKAFKAKQDALTAKWATS
ncbi:hypothetical protein FRX31_021858 [Thalictrum thalictroides]|uniref:Uncharacterized protein n=1 Tax=Thalictrum thalictroides TaxID=46969 RepID=A0A7J6VTZ5_THATH|nr:hypothetical protein FRX31_021858 [Thalictrum thalictroides]